MSGDWSKEALTEAVSESVNYAECLRHIGVASDHSTTQRRKLKIKIEEYDLDISHFTFHARENPGWNKKTPLGEILVKNSTYLYTTKLKRRLVGGGLLDYECEKCGISEWQGKDLTLQLDHINGKSRDNRLENLRLLCPNCHSQTDTFCRRKKGKARTKTNQCVDCDEKILASSTRCVSCSAAQKIKTDWPPTDQLISMVEKTSYTSVGRELGVSDNAVRKRIKNH
jgi:ssDNA-binding Zn-finger/Zn-ribbon topoisomerase 1